MNTTTRAQRINKRYDAIWEAYMQLVAATQAAQDTKRKEKRDSGDPGANAGQADGKP